MISDELKRNLSSRSFWDNKTAIYILPKDNIPRNAYIEKISTLERTNVVVTLMGQRRCGKSIIARQYIKYLWENNVPKTNIFYINLFLKSLADVKNTITFFQAISWWIEEMAVVDQPCYLILDEVQELEDWDENIASIFEDPVINCQIIITGSNSKMLSEELATELSGRYTSLQIFPFSFEEYCNYTQREQNITNFQLYLGIGGMPEVIKTVDEEQRQRLITDIINSTVKHDIVARYNPTNPRLLNDLIDYCRTSFSKELSIKRIGNEVLSKQLSQHSSSLVSEYLQYMEDVFFISLPETYSYRAKDILKRSINKLYIGDLCFGDYKENTEKGRLLENFVFLELRRNNYQVKRYFAYKNRNLEIDFYAEKPSKSILLQVCWRLGDKAENPSLWEREFGNLNEAKLDVDKFVISLDENIPSVYRDIKHVNILDFINML